MTIAFVEPRTFLIVLWNVVKLHDVALERNHIIVEQGTIHIRVAPIEISLTVDVDEHRWVDVVPMLFLPCKRFANRVFEWTLRAVAHEHSNAMTVDRAIHIPFAVAFNNTFCPCAVLLVIPLEILERSHSAMILPVNHVG